MKRTVALLLVLVVLVGTMGCAKNYDDDYDGLWLCHTLSDNGDTLAWDIGSCRGSSTNVLLLMTPEDLYEYIREGRGAIIIDYNEEKECGEDYFLLNRDVFVELGKPYEKEYSRFTVKREKGKVVSIEQNGVTYWRLSDEKVEEITTGKMSLSDFEKIFIIA
ncbi:MAG: hypothetical protein IJF80_04645 [Clostridia bacterium]|nr:hypothetical protein [Clostridia bacterium]